jgi:hypothetical protein
MDTLKIAQELMGAKFDRTQAEAIAHVIQDAWTAEVATKADIALLRAHVDTVETRLSNKLYAVGFAVVLATGIIQHFLK